MEMLLKEKGRKSSRRFPEKGFAGLSLWSSVGFLSCMERHTKFNVAIFQLGGNSPKCHLEGAGGSVASPHVLDYRQFLTSLLLWHPENQAEFQAVAGNPSGDRAVAWSLLWYATSLLAQNHRVLGRSWRVHGVWWCHFHSCAGSDVVYRVNRSGLRNT